MKNQIILIIIAAFLSIISCKTVSKEPLQNDGTEIYFDNTKGPFYHGVASGDPLSSQVVIWTRITPPHHEKVNVSWEVATDSSFQNIVKKGSLITDSQRDYTVKVDVDNLSANTVYHYRFEAYKEYSPSGRTKTTPGSESQNLRLGVVSCSNYEFGYFAAYRHLGDKELDAILHLGDYFYEYGPGTYGDTTINRRHIPPKEIVTLQDYRTRYAQYRLDNDLQYAHRVHPFITIWDDHEITNNSYKTGAQNHQENEGSYEERKAAAKKAYYEWMPVRPSGDDELYRKLDFGGLADIIVLDERLTGRTEQARTPDEVDTSFTMLGSAQLAWFKEQMETSKAVWKIIGNQVIFSQLDLSAIRPKNPKNLDAWDGYSFERDDIIDFISDKGIKNVVFVTGDTHTSWAFEVPKSIEDYGKNGTVVATEFGTTSITSANWNEGNTDAEVIIAEGLVMSSNPHLKFINARDHGYFILTLSESEASASWYYIDDIKDPESGETLAKKIQVKRDGGQLMK